MVVPTRTIHLTVSGTSSISTPKQITLLGSAPARKVFDRDDTDFPAGHKFHWPKGTAKKDRTPENAIPCCVCGTYRSHQWRNGDHCNPCGQKKQRDSSAESPTTSLGSSSPTLKLTLKRKVGDVEGSPRDARKVKFASPELPELTIELTTAAQPAPALAPEQPRGSMAALLVVASYELAAINEPDCAGLLALQLAARLAEPATIAQ